MRYSTNKKISLRFKQWSRKSYAAFTSMGRHVTIGNLKSIVADVLLGKQKNALSIPFQSLFEQYLYEEEERQHPPDELLLLELFLHPCLQQKQTSGSCVKKQRAYTLFI